MNADTPDARLAAMRETLARSVRVHLHTLCQMAGQLLMCVGRGQEVFRATAQEGQSGDPPVVPEPRESRSWRLYARLPILLGDIGPLVESTVRMSCDWQLCRLYHDGFLVARLARRLIEQAGGDVTRFPMRPLDAETDRAIRGRCEEWERGKAQAREAMQRALSAVLTTPETLEGHGVASAAYIRVCERDVAGMVAEWLDRDGSLVRCETLDDLCQFLVGPAVEAFGANAGTVLAEPEPPLEACCRRLRESAPWAARLADEAVRRTGRTGMVLWAGTLPRGVPVQVRLRCCPDDGVWLITAYRPFLDFVLEAGIPDRGGLGADELYYFPPCTLVAGVRVACGRVCLSSPLVRQNAGGFAWRHPYTGELGDADDDEYCWLDGPPPPPPAYEPDDEALALFPRLRQRMGSAGHVTLCLDGLDTGIRELGEHLQAEVAASRTKPDVLRVITESWEQLRMGLTHGHHGNRRLPRVPLTAERMIYRLPVLPEGSLAGRVYPYDLRAGLGSALQKSP
jgi:hypothetical protein